MRLRALHTSGSLDISSLEELHNSQMGLGTSDFDSLRLVLAPGQIVDIDAKWRHLKAIENALSANLLEILSVSPASDILTIGGTVISPISNFNVMIWVCPVDCRVVSVRGFRRGGTSATVNARKNGSLKHLSDNLILTNADQWTDGGSVINEDYVVGDTLELMIVDVQGSPEQVGVQLDFITQ